MPMLRPPAKRALPATEVAALKAPRGNHSASKDERKPRHHERKPRHPERSAGNYTQVFKGLWGKPFSLYKKLARVILSEAKDLLLSFSPHILLQQLHAM